jgi:hypothetical protein
MRRRRQNHPTKKTQSPARSIPAATMTPMVERIDPTPLLHTREQACRMLGGISVSTLIRLEAMGQLTAVKLNKTSKSAQTFYKHDDLVALASGR